MVNAGGATSIKRRTDFGSACSRSVARWEGMMRISLIGATGNAGSRILGELVRRGHQVTAIVRHPERVPKLDGVIAREGDANNADDLASILKGHEVAVSSVHFLHSQADKLIDAVRQARVPRYVV